MGARVMGQVGGSSDLLTSAQGRRILGSMQTGEPQEYFIAFYTEKSGAAPGTIDAVRVRIDLVHITQMDEPMSINLCEHPLYPELRQYVEANKR